MPTSVELAAAASPRAPSYFGVSAEFGRANLQARCARGTQEARPLNFVGAEIERHAAANVSPALVFGLVLQVFRLRGKPFASTGFLTRRFASASGRSDWALRSVEDKPLVVNDGLCHEVEKLARAALFAADATFDCCYPCQTFSTVAFGSPAQMFHVKHRTERNAGGWDPPLNRNRHDRSPPSSELSRADVGATATDRQNRAGAAEGVDFAGWGGLHGRAPGFGRSRGLGRWRICAAIKPVCDI